MPTRRLLIVEDDADFARTLRRSFEKRGYAVSHAASPAELDGYLQNATPDYAVVDLKLGTESGLVCVERLAKHDKSTVIVVLTGYASIATAVEAIKLGAANYLPKPSNSDDIEAAFGNVAGNADAYAHRPADLYQNARMGAYPRGAGRYRLQHLGNRPPPGHAPPHAGAQTGKAADQLEFRAKSVQCIHKLVEFIRHQMRKMMRRRDDDVPPAAQLRRFGAGGVERGAPASGHDD